ncbi:MAG: hypothetical protein Q9224_003466 [Gallowayella concinna]
MILTLTCSWLTVLAVTTAYKFPNTDGPHKPSRKLQLRDEDDPRFSMEVTMSDTKLPATAVYMNAVELAAQYARMDFLGRATQRRGVVLPQFPQVEIAIIPAPPARSVEVRLIIYTIYGLILDMAYGKNFNESEVEVKWENEVKAYIYFTPPVDNSPVANDDIMDLDSHLPADAPLLRQTNSTTTPPANVAFDWSPIYKPNGELLHPEDVFLVVLGAIKVLAPHPETEKVPGPFHTGSDVVDANIQIYLQNRRVSRPTPPFFRYCHVLEAVRRIPGWQLERRRFAEFFCSIEVNRRPLGVLLLEKGTFIPPLKEGNGNLSIA